MKTRDIILILISKLKIRWPGQYFLFVIKSSLILKISPSGFTPFILVENNEPALIYLIQHPELSYFFVLFRTVDPRLVKELESKIGQKDQDPPIQSSF
jgi:hypothetical protein